MWQIVGKSPPVNYMYLIPRSPFIPLLILMPAQYREPAQFVNSGDLETSPYNLCFSSGISLARANQILVRFSVT